MANHKWTFAIVVPTLFLLPSYLGFPFRQSWNHALAFEVMDGQGFSHADIQRALNSSR